MGSSTVYWSREQYRNIFSSSGRLLTDPKHINKRFFDFYKHLYTSQFTASDVDINSFLDLLSISGLSETAVEDLDSNISLNEIKTILKHFTRHTGKGCHHQGGSTLSGSSQLQSSCDT
ncbi:hypothetical protein ILYODFUR_038813 [Ilyodon furcidens]|uniref:Uncharacterized protein n=1 Tax=Ilyodon furcidens TaxID=33524 RepID=A0ABV0UYS7_9TELE